MTRLLLFGAAGRMGQAILRAALRADDLRVTAAIEAAGHPALGRDAGATAGLAPIGVMLEPESAAALARADVAVDFSGPATAAAHAALAAAAGKPLVLGSTGLAPEAAAQVRQAAASVPVVWAPNMSLGVNLLFALVRRAARLLPGYDIEVVETHHRRKQDAPSGTALRLAESAAAGAGLDLAAAAVHGRHGLTGERPAGQIGIHALRAGDVFGDHTVLFATEGERVELTHRASSRDCFAAGALRAARWIAGRAPALYDMQDVLGLKE
jgi:4-hydroxy-tetrahydrodipicolinate reductase